MSKAHPPELKKFMDKRVHLRINGGRDVKGTPPGAQEVHGQEGSPQDQRWTRCQRHTPRSSRSSWTRGFTSGSTVDARSKAHPPELKKFMDKRVHLRINGGR